MFELIIAIVISVVIFSACLFVIMFEFRSLNNSLIRIAEALERNDYEDDGGGQKVEMQIGSLPKKQGRNFGRDNVMPFPRI